MIQALLEEFTPGGFKYDLELDQENCFTHLIFPHPSSIILLRTYPSVFMMDCNYKTNKHKMSLLDIIGVSSFNIPLILALYLCT